jgi:hypothetical protein
MGGLADNRHRRGCWPLTSYMPRAVVLLMFSTNIIGLTVAVRPGNSESVAWMWAVRWIHNGQTRHVGVFNSNPLQW